MDIPFDAVLAALQTPRVQATADQTGGGLADMRQVNELLDEWQSMLAGVAVAPAASQPLASPARDDARPNRPPRAQPLTYRARMALQAYRDVVELD